MEISIDQIRAIAPGSTPEAFFPFINPSFIRFGLKTPSAIGAWVANVAIESANFKRTLEFASGEAYEGRKDLGNVILGDGPKFKGRGLIQLTGRNIYRECSRAIYGNECLLITPSLLESPEAAVLSACWYFQSREILQICNEPETWSRDAKYNKIQYIRLRINGGQNDIGPVTECYERARKILNF